MSVIYQPQEIFYHMSTFTFDTTEQLADVLYIYLSRIVNAGLLLEDGY